MVIEHRPLNQTPPSFHAAKSQPIRGFPAIEPGCSDVAHEHDITLHIKGECVCTLEALGSWHSVSVLETESSVVDRKIGLSQALAAASNSKNIF